MKLSVIVPVYRAEAYLDECVGSLLNQTLGDLEIILVNDGSPDRSGEIMERLAAAHPDRIRTLTLENGGQGRARNRGIEIARGEFLGFVDSDDRVLPDMYEKMVRTAEEQGADVVDCGIEAFYEDGRTEKLRTWRDDRVLAAAGSSCNKIFRRGMIGEIRFPEGLWYEDFEFSALALLRSAKTVHLPDSFYQYRIGQPSTVHNTNIRKNLDILEIMEDLREHMDPKTQKDDFEFLVLNHILIDAINRLAVQDGPEKRDCLFLLRSYVRTHIPRLGASACFRAESRNRRIIMRLNYMGLEGLSRAILERKR